MRAAVWKARAALVYSVGGWTMLGAMIHYTNTTGREAASADGRENGSDHQENQGPRKEVFVTETPLGFKMTTIVTYKEVQPPLTRLLRHLKSYFDPDDEPPSKN
ncbi:small integral membrane protein 26 [Heliangelus exortis]|uniref:small integral membrane protein 26 n=1 Tax=Heliangelus exortis TaxID=472823 RepID=UPI003A8FF3EF